MCPWPPPAALAAVCSGRQQAGSRAHLEPAGGRVLLAERQHAHVGLAASWQGAPGVLSQQGRVQRLAPARLAQQRAAHDLLPEHGVVHRLGPDLARQGLRLQLVAQGVRRTAQAGLLLQKAGLLTQLLLGTQLLGTCRGSFPGGLAQGLAGAALGGLRGLAGQRGLLTHTGQAAQGGLAALPACAAQALLLLLLLLVVWVRVQVLVLAWTAAQGGLADAGSGLAARGACLAALLAEGGQAAHGALPVRSWLLPLPRRVLLRLAFRAGLGGHRRLEHSPQHLCSTAAVRPRGPTLPWRCQGTALALLKTTQQLCKAKHCCVRMLPETLLHV